MSSTRYKGHSSYVLEVLDLNHAKGTTDLKNIFMSVNLYESIHETTMNGNVFLADTLHLQDVLPLYGFNETIDMKFWTKGNEQNPIVYTGVVYKVSERMRLNEFTSGYMLYFCSKEQFNSKRIYVKKKYEDPISDIVTSIYNKYIKVSKPLLTKPTKGLFEYTFGHVDPLESIEMMIPKAFSVENEHSYVFYENNKEFVFKPLQELYTQDPIVKYRAQSAGITSDIKYIYEEQFESYHDFELLEENSVLDRIEDGMHGSDNYAFDMFTKKYVDEIKYDKKGWYDPSKSLGYEPDKRDIAIEDDHVKLEVFNKNQHLTFHKDYVDNRMKARESEVLKARITVMGDSILKAGHVIFAILPRWNYDHENLPTTLDENFLIKKIWHRLTQTEYTQVLSITKDAYNEREV